MVVVKDLDIFDQAGRGIAHDVVVPFKIKQKKLIIEDRAIAFNYEIRVDFVKVIYLNAYIWSFQKHLINLCF